MNRLPEGANWKQLYMAQLSKDNVKLVDLSLSSDAVWAVDDKVIMDKIYLFFKLGVLSIQIRQTKRCNLVLDLR